MRVRVIGAGLAGAEAALVLARMGASVELIDMKPNKMTPAHNSRHLAELVCSNSLKSKQIHTAPGLQKEELKILQSPLMAIAAKHEVPAGGALAVDREGFAREITEQIMTMPQINYISKEVDELPSDELPTLIATGPLTQGHLFAAIKEKLSSPYLHFFDAASPIIDADSINMEIAFKQSRYDKGTADYINCPLDKEQYEAFYEALISADLAAVEGFDKEILFEGCMPVESMAKRGHDTLRFGPLKPVGLTNPHDGTKPYAVVQLRQEDLHMAMYNLVGFQTRLTFPEQRRVFRMIPGLEDAQFLRYGVMHRNTYIAAAGELNAHFQLKNDERLFFAGQITGLEGYVSAIASGHMAARNLFAYAGNGKADFLLPSETINGQLARYISEGNGERFQPMNANFGLMRPLNERIRNKQERGAAYARRAIESLQSFIADKTLNR